MTYSDLNFSIIRHGLTKINEIKQMIGINKQLELISTELFITLIKNQRVIMVIMVFMEIMLINTMPKDI